MENPVIPFPPPISIVAAVVAGIALGPLLFVLSHRPFRVASAGQRLPVAIALSVLGWAGVLLISGSLTLNSAEDLANIVAGLFILGGAAIVAYIFWSYLIWGFTLTLLLNIAAKAKPVSLDEWMDSYGGSDNGKGSQALFDGRLTLLVRTGMATIDGQQVRLTKPLGTLTGYLSAILAFMFNLEG